MEHLPPFGQSSTSSRAQHRPPPSSSSSSKNRPSTAPTSSSPSFLPSTSIHPGASSSTTTTPTSSRTPSLLSQPPSSPATSFDSSFHPTKTPMGVASREDILPWESVSTIKQSGPKPTILSSSIIIDSIHHPPKASSSAAASSLLLHPTSPPSSSSNRNHHPPPTSSSLQRSFSQRPPSLAYNLVTRPSEQHPTTHPYSNPTSFGGAAARNVSTSASASRPPHPSILSLAEGAATKGKEKPGPVRHYLVGTTTSHSDWKVLDQESLLGETMRFCLGGDEGERNTFVELQEGEGEPARVLDIGCGLGLWCLEQAQAWKSSRFVGLDLDPVQVDLEALVEIQRDTGGVRKDGEGVDWEEVAKRVEWVQADFLKTLPFDSGSFDFVHLRWVNLGIPEAGWQDLLEEVARILKKGTGVLEIIETSNTLPTPTPLLSPPSTPNLPTITTSPVQSPSSRPRYDPTSSYTSHSSAASSSPSTPRHHTPTSSISAAAAGVPTSGANSFGGSPTTTTSAKGAGTPNQQLQRTKYERHLETHLIQPTASIVVRPALLMTSGLSKVKMVGDYAWSRDGEEEGKKRAPGVLAETTSIWAESMFPSHTHSHFPSPFATQTAILITTELHQTYGLEGYAPRAPPGSELKKGAGGRLRKLLSGQTSPASPPSGQVVGVGTGGGKVESWVWVGRKTA